MKRILFVDDEQNILDAMRNMLRKQRKVWDMCFVSSGEEALAELSKAPFDVIVSDMRMPVMDGATLLEKVRNLYPRTARFVLSGQADQDSIFRVLPYAQQFLSKPCDPDEMRRVVDRTCTLQATIESEAIRTTVGNLSRLPTATDIYWKLTEAIHRPEINMTEIASIVEQDPALVAKILQIVNSAFFGLAKKTSSIAQAVCYLGIDLLRALAVSVKAFGAFEGDEAIRGIIRDIQQNSLETAKLAVQFVSDREKADHIFTAALLRDVGILALVQGNEQAYLDLLLSSSSATIPLHQMERELGLPEHAAVGAHLLGLWGLPFQIVEAVAGHHRPKVDAAGENEVLLAVHVADALTNPNAVDNASRVESICLPAFQAIGMEAELHRWLKVYAEHVRRQTSTPTLSP